MKRTGARQPELSQPKDCKALSRRHEFFSPPAELGPAPQEVLAPHTSGLYRRLPARPWRLWRLRGMKRERNGAAKAGSADERRGEVLEKETKALAEKYTRGESVKTRVPPSPPTPCLPSSCSVFPRGRRVAVRSPWSRGPEAVAGPCPKRKTSNPNRQLPNPEGGPGHLQTSCCFPALVAPPLSSCTAGSAFCAKVQGRHSAKGRGGAPLLLHIVTVGPSWL